MFSGERDSGWMDVALKTDPRTPHEIRVPFGDIRKESNKRRERSVLNTRGRGERAQQNQARAVEPEGIGPGLYSTTPVPNPELVALGPKFGTIEEFMGTEVKKRFTQ
ncbi:hypothetical protein B0H13DRAFT_1897484 [Mycena leptocephala]|nr:hypothetical protein B0H13DRAFT_1897484 [Mycena leptocephala]